MNTTKHLFFLLAFAVLLAACEKDIRNIAGEDPEPEPVPVQPVNIVPIDINQDGFDFLEYMQGQWTGYMKIIGDEHDWFAFDYRAISPSNTFGIFEGGTGGNLFTSFFVTDFKNTRTLMARNGGVLNGIYRTSYFVLDSIRANSNSKYYRFVDAIGGPNVMSMELRFVADSLYFNAYTSRLGLNDMATRHMTFKARRNISELAETAATAVGYPQNIPAWDFSEGFVEENLYTNAEGEKAKSASFLAFEGLESTVYDLAPLSGDPWTINEQPHLGFLQIDIERYTEIADKTLMINLSHEPLTDASGYYTFTDESLGSILSFPVLEAGEEQFWVTYLHPGNYYVNIMADMDGDGSISNGDLTHPPVQVTVDPEGENQVTISNITIEN